MELSTTCMENFSVDSNQPAYIAIMAIRWHHCRIICDLEYEKAKSPVEYALIRDFVKASVVHDEEKKTETVEQLYDIIVGLGQDRFDKLSPQGPFTNLEKLYKPHEYKFSLKNVDGSSQLIEEHVKGNTVVFPRWASLLNVSHPQFDSLPRYEAKNIDVISVLRKNSRITTVRVEGRKMIAMTDHANIVDVERQLWGGVDIATRAAQQNRHITVPKILGLIEIRNSEDHDGKDVIVGILKEYVVGNPDEEAAGYASAPLQAWSQQVRDAIPLEKKEEWLAHIREMVEWLHENGQVWVNGGPNAVVIEGMTGEAWLMGCGEAGLDEEAMIELRMLDKMALWRIANFLGLGTESLVDMMSDGDDGGYYSGSNS